MALRVGGNFFYDPQPKDLPANVVLIAGGVGINPLFSILLHIADLHRTQEKKGNSCKVGTAKLFYCAKNVHELLFRVCFVIYFIICFNSYKTHLTFLYLRSQELQWTGGLCKVGGAVS